MKKILTLICTLLCANVLLAQTFWVDSLQYEVTYSTWPREVKVHDADPSITIANIPATVIYDGYYYSVTLIEAIAFYDCSSLTSVDIPNSVTYIGESAFANCSSLTSVNIPNSVISIRDRAFQNCDGLTSVTIPNSVTYTGGGVFCLCDNLTSVTLSNNITSLPASSDGYGYGFFQGCSSLTSITIPNSVTSIGQYAFYNCSGLTSVTIPNSVTSIGSSAFSNCSSLTSVTIPNSVTSIGNYAFYYCSSLTSVTCLRSISPSLGDYVFDGTLNNKTLTIPCGCESEYTDWQNATTWAGIDCIVPIGGLFTIGDLTYEVTSETELKVQACTQSATSVVIPATVTYQGTTYSVTTIGAWAFEDCSSLTSVTIPNSVTSIGNNAFYDCSSLTSVTIPNSVTSIGIEAFSGCSSLTSVTIPNSVTSIGAWAFEDCSSLTSVTIPNSVTSIEAWAFENCSSLTSVTIPNSVTSIGVDVFAGCNSLTSMTIDMTYIPNLSNIGINSALQNLTLGENVTSIRSGAFNNYNSLQNVTCLATTPPTLADNTVFPYPNIASLKVPCGSLEAYSAPTSLWNTFFAGRISDGYNVVATTNDNAFGSVAVESDCYTATLTATASDCYEFLRWNDGNTENPRLVSLSSDTAFTAIFSEVIHNTIINASINPGETYTEYGFNASEAGTYILSVTTEGCDSTITLILTVNSSLLEAEAESISFFPNPTKSEITFSQAIEKVEVIDLIGKAILTFSNAREINIESLPAGAYYLRLTNNDKAVLRKLIKE